MIDVKKLEAPGEEIEVTLEPAVVRSRATVQEKQRRLAHEALSAPTPFAAEDIDEQSGSTDGNSHGTTLPKTPSAVESFLCTSRLTPAREFGALVPMNSGKIRLWAGVPLTETQRSRVRAVCDRIEFVEPARHGLFIPMPPDVDIAFGWPIVEDVLASSTLRWLQLRGAGSDAYRRNEALRRTKLLITTAHGVFDIAGAEHVLAMMLYFARALGPSLDQQRRSVWDLAAIRPLMGELHDQTVAIFGLGGFGREIARRASAFGMRVLGVRRAAGTTVECVDEMFTLAESGKVLAQADHVVLALPDTAETNGFFNAGLIGTMKPTAYLYNIARGSLVDEEALLAALQNRRIAGAGLDVFDTEPLPADSPFWKLPNVLITPHSAGRSPREFDRMVDLFCDNLGRYLKGQPLRNVLNFERGY